MRRHLDELPRSCSPGHSLDFSPMLQDPSVLLCADFGFPHPCPTSPSCREQLLGLRAPLGSAWGRIMPEPVVVGEDSGGAAARV